MMKKGLVTLTLNSIENFLRLIVDLRNYTTVTGKSNKNDLYGNVLFVPLRSHKLTYSHGVQNVKLYLFVSEHSFRYCMFNSFFNICSKWAWLDLD